MARWHILRSCHTRAVCWFGLHAPGSLQRAHGITPLSTHCHMNFADHHSTSNSYLTAGFTLCCNDILVSLYLVLTGVQRPMVNAGESMGAHAYCTVCHSFLTRIDTHQHRCNQNSGFRHLPLQILAIGSCKIRDTRTPTAGDRRAHVQEHAYVLLLSDLPGRKVSPGWAVHLVLHPHHLSCACRGDPC